MCANILAIKLDSDLIERQFCEKCNWVYYPHSATTVAGALVIQNKVLLVQRIHEPYPGSWLLPSGFVTFGEHPFDALTREFKEETGLSVEVRRFLSMAVSTDDWREPGHLALFCEVKNPTGDLIVALDENSSVGWFSLENLPEILLVNHAKVVEQLTRSQP